jgi:hypothetical protein
MIDPIKGFADVNSDRRCTSWGFRVIKTISDPGGKREKSRSSGAERNKAVLGRSRRKGSREERKKKSF